MTKKNDPKILIIYFDLRSGLGSGLDWARGEHRSVRVSFSPIPPLKTDLVGSAAYGEVRDESESRCRNEGTVNDC